MHDEILLGYGLSKIYFGSSKKEVEAILGKPERNETIDYLGDNTEVSEQWFYFDNDLELTFDNDDDFRLSRVQIYSNSYQYEGTTFIGLSKAEVLKLGEKFQWGFWESNDTSTPIDSWCNQISYDEKSIDFWFDNNVVESVSWGYFWKNDEEPIWPSENEDGKLN